MTCCDHRYGHPSRRPRVSAFATYLQVRLGTNPAVPRDELPGTRRKRLRCAWHAHLCGLATAIHETSGLANNRQPPAGLLNDEKDPGVDHLSLGMSFDQFQHLVVLLASGCWKHFPTDLIGNFLSQILLHPLSSLRIPRQGERGYPTTV